VNIYIGANGKIAEVDLSTSVTTAQGSESLSLTLALSGYGRPVNVTAPPRISDAALICTYGFDFGTLGLVFR